MRRRRRRGGPRIAWADRSRGTPPGALSDNRYEGVTRMSSAAVRVGHRTRRAAMKRLAIGMCASGLALACPFAAAAASPDGTTTLESVSTEGAQANLYSYAAAISADGRYVVFSSDGTNLVPHDTNQRTDAFVRDRRTGVTTR